jgi:hypothetical protein
LGKVVKQQEMINWCIQNPLEGAPLALDDPKLKAMESYINYERRGVPMAPGKHQNEPERKGSRLDLRRYPFFRQSINLLFPSLSPLDTEYPQIINYLSLTPAPLFWENVRIFSNVPDPQ